MIIPNYPTCFVCGHENNRGLNMTFESEGNTITSQFTPEPNLCSYTGVLHGGIIASILDEGMGWTGYPSTEKYFFTAELTVRYKKPVSTDRTYTLKAELISMRKRLYVAKGSITDAEGTVYATGEGKYMLLNEPDKDKISKDTK